MASDVCWNNLPSVVLLEIFKRITHQERIHASATCKEWRKALFFPNFWREISINIYSKTDKYAIERCQFFTRSFMSSLRSIKIIFTYEKHYLMQLCEIITKLAGNGQMLRLHLYGFGKKPRWNQNVSCCIISLRMFLEKVKSIESLYIRHCWLPLLENDTLKLMLEKHKDSITSLGLGAVYDKSLKRHIVKFPVDIAVFQHLTILNLDHSWITDEVLCGIVNKRLLQRLTMQVDGKFKGHQAKMETWKYFHQALSDVMQIFSESMPVTHIKILYCDEVDLTVMDTFYTFKNLKSVWCISEQQKSDIVPAENPFVICAWVCPKLEELVLVGKDCHNLQTEWFTFVNINIL
ncbi:UNVERIFIED_CONTAM: hypothetical protein PYX00_000767 [Menopon gallinae]|uniref:F-box domain-containing protein n=1 Tax=Menopon gallinae TaxID=328185 RepID=A0AAW2IBT2_9NEOP